MKFDFDEKWYEEDGVPSYGPEELSPDDIEDIEKFLADYDRTELVETFIISKYSNRGGIINDNDPRN